jgi:HPt (histidine-containing phosphotransfer) domain-containing protein
MQVFAELQDAAGADFVTELIGTFLDEAPTQLQALHSARASGDEVAFRRAAHTMKTNALTFGAMTLGLQCGRLEHAGLASSDAALQAMEHAHAQAVQALEALRHG